MYNFHLSLKKLLKKDLFIFRERGRGERDRSINVVASRAPHTGDLGPGPQARHVP